MIRVLSAILALAFLPSSLANDPNVDPNGSVYGYCILCHGMDGRGSEPVAAPRIGGMEKWYLVRQLNGFRRGWRGNHPDDVYGNEMQTMARALADEDAVDEVAGYFAAYNPPALEHTIGGNAERGRVLFDTCRQCHGAAARGNREANAPALAGQSDWYLVNQLNHFRRGLRGNDPGDEAGIQMRLASDSLENQQDVQDVVAYINSLP